MQKNDYTQILFYIVKSRYNARKTYDALAHQNAYKARKNPQKENLNVKQKR